MKRISVILLVMCISALLFPQKDSAPDSVKKVILSGLSFRSIGPAITGGRVIDIAVNPSDQNEYFVASGHGSLWKTTNGGTTFRPVFDSNPSYAIGCVVYDPSNPNIIWVGTGENQSQSNVIYGDGVYKSEDGGKTWKNMGLSTSEHIGGIVIDPEHSNVVYVAAMGSQRNPGGERGIFKTTDGGKTWKNVLSISQYTGCYQVHMDPRYPNLLYATAHQRMRNLYTGIYGGPESGIYRSIDNGETWEKITNGLPSEDVGRIGMDISPVNPDYIYAIVEAKEGDKGIYKSTDRGASWTKQSSYVATPPFYYQELYCDTKDVNRLYSADVFNKVSIDGGKTWQNLGERFKHVDNHALWIDPLNNRHLLNGCDGGLYETFDQGQNWSFKSNIPIAEIYKVTTDNAEPFYNVYIGTQDNNSLGGPARTISSAGILNQDWLFTNSGDGFKTQVDWKDPNIIYAQSQNGGLVRFDKKSGENLYIRPYDFNDTAYRFDWDAALLISKFDNKRLYMGGNKVFRTDDRGNTWREISFDLTRGVPRELQKLMGQSWSIDQLSRKAPMAQIVTIAESPLDENILYSGSGDGLIYFTTDGGKNWTKSKIPGLPEYARIHQVVASNFDKKIAFAACQNMLGGDYKPYVYKTTDGGGSWFIINGNLPQKGSTYTIAEDQVNKDLLFLGTQFGVFFSYNGGDEWIQLKNGIPPACVMDLDIQRRENDLVVSTFGRGVYILDDYTPLRTLTKELIQKEAEIFPIKDALMFVPSNPFGFKGTAFQGANFYSAPNPEIGAVFTYYLRDEVKTLKQKRRDEEKERVKKGEDIIYPDYATLKKEQEQPEAYILFTVTDSEGNIVRNIKRAASKGVNRIVWDFRYDAFSPVSLEDFDASIPWAEPDKGYMVVPGKYYVTLSKFEDGKYTQLVPAREFVCKPLNITSLPPDDWSALNLFNKKTGSLVRALTAADAYRSSLTEKIVYLKKAIFGSPLVPAGTYEKVISIEKELAEFNLRLNGDPLRARYEGDSPTSVKARVDLIAGALWNTTSGPTETFIHSYNAAADRTEDLLAQLKKIDDEVSDVEKILEQSGAPYTPGRFPTWKKP